MQSSLIAIALCSVSLVSGVSTLHAQGYPRKPVRIIVPFSAGGGTDTVTRIIGRKMSESTGQQFLIDNRPSAGGNIAFEMTAKADPDGYTILNTSTGIVVNPVLYKKVNYDPEKDFSVVGVIGASGAFLIVPTDSPYKSLADLLTHAKANPGKLNFAYFNASSQVPPEVLAKTAGIEWQGIAYKAIGNAWNDLYAGTIQFMFVDLTASRGQVVAGKARPLGITLPERSRLYPEVPTIGETFPGFATTGMLAVAVARAAPEAIKQRLNELVNEAVFSPEINKRLVDEFALTPARLSLAQCAERDRNERAKWAEYVRIARIEPQ